MNGKPGQNGAKNGDLFIKINIKNTKKYKLEGYDIYTDLLLAPWEAALGTRARGDLIANIKIVVPKQLSEEETKIYEKLKEISKFEPRS